MIRNIYKVKVNFIGHYTAPENGTPVALRNSHIYDVDYPAWFSATMTICAGTFSGAETYAEQYQPETDRSNPNTMSITEIEVISITYLGYTKSDYECGVIDVDYDPMIEGKYEHAKYD